METNTMIIAGIVILFVILIVVLLFKKERYGESLPIRKENLPILPIVCIFVKPEVNVFIHPKDAFLCADYFQTLLDRRIFFMYHIVDKLPGAGNEDDNFQVRTYVPGREETVRNVKIDLYQHHEEVRRNIHMVNKSISRCMAKECEPHNTEHFHNADYHKYDYPVLSMFYKPDIDSFLNAGLVFTLINNAQERSNSRIVFMYHVTDKLPGVHNETANAEIRLFIPGEGEFVRVADIIVDQPKEEIHRSVHAIHESVYNDKKDYRG
jgi:hypothetical protein